MYYDIIFQFLHHLVSEIEVKKYARLFWMLHTGQIPDEWEWELGSSCFGET